MRIFLQRDTHLLCKRYASFAQEIRIFLNYKRQLLITAFIMSRKDETRTHDLLNPIQVR